MNEEKIPFSKTFEELLTKSIEANKLFITEGARVFKQFTKQETPINPGIFKNEAITKAFNEYVTLNVNHFSNLINLGLSFLKNSSPGENEKSEDVTDNPSFILEKNGAPGEVVSFQFLLDNVKQETVTCQFIHSGYVMQENPSNIQDFTTQFTPLSFQLKPGESKPVSINTHIPEGTAPGLYISKVQVRGFEPAYFSILLTVTDTIKPTAHARKQAKPGQKH